MHDEQVMSESEVAAALRVGSSKLRQFIREGKFPRGFFMEGTRGRRWLGRDVSSFLWLQSRVRTTRKPKEGPKKGKKDEKPKPETA